MAPFVLLVGTMTGNAEFAAEEMIQILKDEFGREAELRLMDGLGADVFRPGTIYLICTSTYGEGEVPENAKAFYTSLCEQRPDLSAIRYAVFGLGDSGYQDTFNFGGKRFDDILAELGAQRLGERGKHDIRSDVQPWDYGRDWLRGWYESLQGTLE
jgi:MioC protein